MPKRAAGGRIIRIWSGCRNGERAEKWGREHPLPATKLPGNQAADFSENLAAGSSGREAGPCPN